MKQGRYIIVLVLVVLLSSFVQQSDKEFILTVLKKAARYSTLEKGQSYYIEMVQRVEYHASSNQKPINVNTKMILREGRMLYENDFITVYTDNNETVTIRHSDKQIIISPSGLTNWNYQSRVQSVAELQDSLVRTGTILASVKLTENIKRYTLKVASPFKEKHKLSRIIFEINTNTNKLKKVTNVYQPHTIKRKEIVEYKVINYDYPYKPFNKAMDMIYTGKILKKKYQGYSVLDTRK
jgi:hypothetical protein